MSSVNTLGEICENCGRSIGRLEAPHVYNDHVVCLECLRRLSPPAIAPPPPLLPPPILEELDDSPRPQLGTIIWLWVGGIALIMAGLGSLRAFPDLFAAPFLIVAGALLLPPGWSRVARRWPAVSGLSRLVRTAACVIAFVTVLVVMPKTPSASSTAS